MFEISRHPDLSPLDCYHLLLVLKLRHDRNEPTYRCAVISWIGFHANLTEVMYGNNRYTDMPLLYRGHLVLVLKPGHDRNEPTYRYAIISRIGSNANFTQVTEVMWNLPTHRHAATWLVAFASRVEAATWAKSADIPMSRYFMNVHTCAVP